MADFFVGCLSERQHGADDQAGFIQAGLAGRDELGLGRDSGAHGAICEQEDGGAESSIMVHVLISFYFERFAGAAMAGEVKLPVPGCHLPRLISPDAIT